jgi:hypothetical protein
MARKKDPNDVLDAFHAELAAAEGLWTTVRQSIGTTGDVAKQLSVAFFLRMALAFEVFRSDWHLAAINRDSTQLKETLNDKLKARVDTALATRVRVELPTHPSLQLIRELLDPSERNISLPDMASWRSKADDHLVDPWRAKVYGITGADAKLIDAVIALRNLLAHESTDASNTANEALRSLSNSQDAGLRRGEHRISPSGVGAYLNAQWPGTSRVLGFHGRLKQITETMRV